MKDCYGKRTVAKDECEECDLIEQCSVMTLELIFKDKIVIVV